MALNKEKRKTIVFKKEKKRRNANICEKEEKKGKYKIDDTKYMRNNCACLLLKETSRDF